MLLEPQFLAINHSDLGVNIEFDAYLLPPVSLCFKEQTLADVLNLPVLGCRRRRKKK